MSNKITAGLPILSESNTKKEKKISSQKSIANLKIVKPNPSQITRTTSRPTTSLETVRNNTLPSLHSPPLVVEDILSSRNNEKEQKVGEKGQQESKQPKQQQPKQPKQIVRKNTITQLNHVPFPQRKVIFSIDPGRVNFACRLEERKDDGTIEGLLFIKARFEELLDINQFFDKHHHLLSQATICIVEKQMSINYTMIRISQHVETYFLTKFPNVAVYEISAKLKVGKDDTIETAKTILTKGKDETSVDLLERLGNPQKVAGQRKPKKEKLDDLCDTVCQIEAFMDEMKRLEYKVPQGYVLQTKAGGKK
jgi:hypothetical protein